MNITIDIAADIEPRLLQEAARQGVDPGQYIVNAVRARLENGTRDVAQLDAQQSRLLEEINQGLSQAEWNQYYALVAKRQAGTLSDVELVELTTTSDRIEELNARRMERLADLARLRGTTLPELVDQLGIVPPPVI